MHGQAALIQCIYPLHYSGSVKGFLNDSMKELEEREKGKKEAPEKIKQAEIKFYLDIINGYIVMGRYLSKNDYKKAKDLYNQWVIQLPIEDLIKVVYDSIYENWSYHEGVPNFLYLAKTFKDYDFLAQIIEIHRELLVGTEKEEQFYNLEEKYFDILDRKETFDSFYLAVNNRKSFLINPKADKKKKWSVKLDSLKKAGFDSLVIIAGEKYLELGPEKENRNLYIERNNLWVKILSAAERRNDFLLWKGLLDKYSNDLLLSEYNSKKHKKDTRAFNKKHRGALKENENKWKDFNEKKSKKVLLKKYAQIYNKNFQIVEEISTRLKILSEFNLSDEEAVREYGMVLLNYIDLGKFNNAEKILDIIEKKYNNSDYSANRYRLISN